MGIYGDSISTTVPAVGDPETTASAAASSLLTEFKTRLTSKVTPAGMNINATLDMNSQAQENLSYTEFVTRGSAPTLNETLYTKNVTRDELFYKDSAGSEVQLTSNGSLNVAATGAITGAGYGSGGVALNWNSAGSNYQFKSGSGADAYAILTCDGVQYRDDSSNHVYLAAPTGMSANINMVLPATLPSAGRYATIDGSGNLSVTRSVKYNAAIRHPYISNGTDSTGYYTLAASTTDNAGWILHIPPACTINSVNIRYWSSLTAQPSTKWVAQQNEGVRTTENFGSFINDSTARTLTLNPATVTTTVDGDTIWVYLSLTSGSGNLLIYGIWADVSLN